MNSKPFPAAFFRLKSSVSLATFLIISGFQLIHISDVARAAESATSSVNACLRDAEELTVMNAKVEESDLQSNLDELESKMAKYREVLAIHDGSSEILSDLEKKREDEERLVKFIDLYKERMKKVISSPTSAAEDKKLADETAKLADQILTGSGKGGWKPATKLGSSARKIEDLKRITPQVARQNLELTRDKLENLAKNWDDFDRQWQSLEDRFEKNRCPHRLKLEDKWRKEFDKLSYSSSPTECIRMRDRARDAERILTKAKHEFEEFNKGEFSPLQRASEILKNPQVMEQETAKIQEIKKMIFGLKQVVAMVQESSGPGDVRDEFSIRLGKLLAEHPILSALAAGALLQQESTLKSANGELEKLKALVEKLKGQPEAERDAVLKHARDKSRRLETQMNQAEQAYSKFFPGKFRERCHKISPLPDFDDDADKETERGALPNGKPTGPAQKSTNVSSPSSKAIN